MKRVVDTVKLNSNLAEQLRTLVIMPSRRSRGVKEARYGPPVKLIEQVLILCHGISAIARRPPMLSSPLHLIQSLDSPWRLLLLVNELPVRRIDSIENEPGGDREKDPEGLETYDWGVEVRLVIVDTRDLGEITRYEACLVLNECAILNFPVEVPS